MRPFRLIGIVFLWLASASLALLPAQFVQHRRKAFQAAPATYLINQNFEGTGYDNGETWTESGTPNEDATPALVGSQSLEYTGSNQNAYASFTAQTTVYAYAQVRRMSQPTGTNGGVFSLRSTDGVTGRVSFAVNYNSPNTEFKIATDGTFSAASATVQAGLNDKTWHVWLKYVANGTCELAMSETGTKPTAAGAGVVFLEKADTSGGTAGRIYAYVAANDGGWKVDRVLVSTSPIGNNP